MSVLFMSRFSDYQIIGHIYANQSILIQSAQCLGTEQFVLLISMNKNSRTAKHLYRFTYAYELLKRFEHSNIIKVLDWIESDTNPLMVVEDQGFIDLKSFLDGQKDEPLPLTTFLKVAIQICNALSEIHLDGIVLNNLHTSNILINPESMQIKLFDFAFSSLLSEEQVCFPPVEQLNGVLEYISPEQTGRMNRKVDYRSDFYSLGIVFYELLTGHTPFQDEDKLTCLQKHITRQHLPVTEIRSDVPESISQIIDKLLAKKAEDRYQYVLGLIYDLEKEKPRQATLLSLGHKDFPGKLHLSQRLYGLDHEISELLKHCQRAVYGKPQILAITGASGIGKTSLIGELHKPIAVQKGLFLSGKLDQHSQNSPFTAIKQAFRVWIQHAQALDTYHFETLQVNLKQSLGVNARLLVDFIPEMASILGQLPEVPSLTPTESQSRLNHLLCQFVACISQMQPLVLFLDDLQWADQGTLKFIQSLMQMNSGHFLLVVAYRDNEVNHLHPSIIALKQIEHLQTLSLSALSQNDVEQYLSDTLNQPRQAVSELATFIKQKTGGNPFFIKALLKHYDQTGALEFDIQSYDWCWDISGIKAMQNANNISELITHQIQQLPPKSSHILHISACLGGRFDLARLAIAAGESMADCATQIWPTLKAGLILQESGDCFFEIASLIDLRGLDFDLTQGAQVPQCRFSHDQVQEAAYHDSDQHRLKQTHLTIGRRLLEYYQHENQNPYLFGTVKHLNKSRTLISNPEERLQLAELNKQAAQKAKRIGVWEAAGRYADIGRELLPPQSWQLHYELAKALSLMCAECVTLAGDQERAETLYQEVMQETWSKQDKAELCLKQMLLLFSQGKWQAAITIAEQGLNYCGICTPTSEQSLFSSLDDTNNELEKLIAITPITEISSFSEMSNPLQQIAIGLLANLGVCYLAIGKVPYLEFYIKRGLLLTYLHGKTDLSALVMTVNGFLKAIDEQYHEAVEYADQALEIMATYPHCREASNTLNLLSAGILHFQQKTDQVIKLHQQGYKQGLAEGETMHAIVNLNNILFHQLTQGDVLGDIKYEAESCAEITASYKIFQPTNLVAKKLVESLTSNNYFLDDTDFEANFLSKIKHSFHSAFLDHVRLLYLFWSNKPILEKQNYLLQISSRLQGISVVLLKADHHFIAGLTLIESLIQCPDSSERNNYSERLEVSFNKIQKLAKFCPENFGHKFYLLQAEMLRLQEYVSWDAMPYYQQAIDSAKKYGYLHYQALANELCGEFCLRQNNIVAANVYLSEAHKLYEKWGCQVRINDLLKRHGDILTNIEMQNSHQQYSNTAETKAHYPQTSILITQTHLAEKRRSKQHLDLTTVIKATQAISSEVQVNKLIATVIHIIMENTGAQIGALVLAKEGGASIEAYQNTLSGDSNFLHAYCLEASSNLPVILIQAALSNKETILLADGSAGTPYQSDRYLQKHKTQSLLCFPVKHREQVIGMLYLEHRTLTGVFTEERLKLIQLLMAQASISLENARLFSDAQQFNSELEQKVKTRTAALQNTNEKLHYLATHDPLTDMFNRRYFMDNGETAFEAALKNESSLAVMIMDIDHFKHVNDNYGHPAGDKVLIAVTQHCQQKLRSGDILGRLGGEEFGVLLPDTTQEDALAWAKKLVVSLRPVEVATDKGIIKITMSIGLCCLTFPSSTPISEALQQADEALYIAKESGRDQARLFAK